MSTTTTSQSGELRDALVERLFNATIQAQELFSVYLGSRLGLYAVLADGAPRTPEELSAQAGIDARYAREWLEQQAVAGFVDVDEGLGEGGARRFRLPEAHTEVLVQPESLSYVAPFSLLMAGIGRVLPELVEAYRRGGGVSYADYGADLRDGQAAINRPAFTHELAASWLPAMPDVHARLQADPPARVAELGCGAGWASIALARGYPKIRVDGFDLDEASIADARANVSGTGVEDRVSFQVRDATDPALAGSYDLVCIFEALHDLARPVEALAAMRAMLVDGGSVLVADERVGERFTAPGDEIERMMYGWSVLHCLPAAMPEQPSPATGTVMRSNTLRRYASDAGFMQVEVLPIDNHVFRFYRLRP